MQFPIYGDRLNCFLFFFVDGLHVTVAVALWHFNLVCFEVCSNDFAQWFSTWSISAPRSQLEHPMGR